MELNGQDIYVYKASGEKEPFRRGKLKQSLLQAGAGYEEADQIIDEVEEMLVEGIPTKEIYKKALSLLLKKSRSMAARYKLKNAIMELEPLGFEFRRYVDFVLQYQKYSTNVGSLVKGNCIHHEVDVVAENKRMRVVVECRFQNGKSKSQDVKVALYVQAKFKDIERTWLHQKENGDLTYQGWIITNTRFTSDALQYGHCVGLKLIAWNYPSEGSLKALIDDSGLYPITCLTTLTKKEKQQLLAQDCVLCIGLCKKPDILTILNISANRKKKIMNEAYDLCAFNGYLF